MLKLPASSKREEPYAWGICLLFAKHPTAREFSSGHLISLGSSRTSFKDFSIAEKDLWCSYGKVRLTFSDKAQNEEKQRLMFAILALQAQNQICFEDGVPVAFFCVEVT